MPRVGHTLSALALGDHTGLAGLYVLYGGESSYGDVLSDLWAFNRSNASWASIRPNSVPPPARAGHCAAAMGTDSVLGAPRQPADWRFTPCRLLCFGMLFG